MEHSKFLPFLILSWVMFLQSTHQLQNSHTQVLYQLQKHLEFPKALESWGTYYGDLCVIVENASDRVWFGSENPSNIPNGLTRLTSLRVLSLVSLGIYGEFSGKIHRLNSLEYLDLSSNYLFGSVPPDISRLVMLQSLMLDGNYFNGSVPDTLDSLTNLTVLSLKNNRFKGSFPSSICRMLDQKFNKQLDL